MATRDAVSTIRGYFYQFDYSILQVLKQKNDETTICIEGIEDIDINDADNIVLHQCKCYEGTEYNHSIIKDAVCWMLKHFSENKNSYIKYYIYGVYKSGQDKLPKNIDVNFAKTHFFTKKHRKDKYEYLYTQLNLSDDDILFFLKKLTININALSFDLQEKNVRNELCAALGCRMQEVEPYYCNALSIIRRLATQKNCSDRSITRGEFIQKIKSVDNQFEVWLLHKNGIIEFSKAIKKKYFNNGFNISPYNRFFLLECNKNTSITDLKSTILSIAKKYSKLSQRAKPKFCPFFCFYGIDEVQLLEIKNRLAKDNVIFTDGYNYRGAEFNPLSIVKEPTKDCPISLRIVDNIDFLENIYELLSSTIEIYQFYNNEVFYINEQYKHIKIPFERIIDIVGMV